MAGAADVLVIGGGIIGCAAARELARRGARVRIFESRSIGAGASYASAGVLAPLIEAHAEDLLLELTSASLAMYDGFIADVRRESGLEVEFRRCGTMEIATSPAGQDRLQAAATALASRGAAVEWLDGPAARAAEPPLPASTLGALLIQHHGYVVVAKLIDALTWAALRYGADIETSRRIVAIDEADTRVSARAEDGTEWTAEYAVIASGSWAGQMKLGAADFAAAVYPVRGQLLRLAWTGRALSHVLWGPDCYVVPWADGTVLVGATMEEVGFDERTTAAGVRDLLDAVCDLLPEAWSATFLEARAGLRPATPDHLPIIGSVRGMPRTVYAAGHFRNGVLLAPLTAQLLADLILKGRPAPVLRHLGPERRTLTGSR
jgi:glycine oxidase